MTVTADIIVPVWNRPVETRECLVSLMEHSPSARIVMVDSGSDRETEALLEEFAEILGDRALLLRTEVNLGFIRSVNRGLRRVDAPWAVVVKSGTVVSAGWLDAIIGAGEADPAAGIVVPRSLHRKERGRKIPVAPAFKETSPTAFDAVALRKELITRCGVFDESLDGREWALRDYSRRSWREGFVSVYAGSSVVFVGEEIFLGSETRREEAKRRAVEAYLERWGEERAFLLFFGPGTAEAVFDGLAAPVLEAARQGDRLTILVDHRAYRSARKGRLGSLHDSVRLEPLPLFFSGSALRKRVEEWRTKFPAGIVIAGGSAAEGIAGDPPSRLLEEIALRRRDKYSNTGVA